jgi:hypothetical protein
MVYMQNYREIRGLLDERVRMPILRGRNKRNKKMPSEKSLAR